MNDISYEEWSKQNPIDWDSIQDNEDCLVTRDFVEMAHYQMYLWSKNK